MNQGQENYWQMDGDKWLADNNNINHTVLTAGLANPAIYATSSITGSNETTIPGNLKVDSLSLGGKDVGSMLSAITERLNIILPDVEKHSKYEALKRAYDDYKLIEAMLNEK